MTTTAMGPTTALASRMMRVMVVEDHELMREALERRLSAAEGFDLVAGVDSVTAAEKTFEAVRPDLVLVDHSLPDGAGMDVLRLVKDANPATVVVMLSAHDDPSLISSYLAAGANGFAHKTVGAAELLSLITPATRRSWPASPPWTRWLPSGCCSGCTNRSRRPRAARCRVGRPRCSRSWPAGTPTTTSPNGSTSPRRR